MRTRTMTEATKLAIENTHLERKNEQLERSNTRMHAALDRIAALTAEFPVLYVLLDEMGHLQEAGDPMRAASLDNGSKSAERAAEGDATRYVRGIAYAVNKTLGEVVWTIQRALKTPVDERDPFPDGKCVACGRPPRSTIRTSRET